MEIEQDKAILERKESVIQSLHSKLNTIQKDKPHFKNLQSSNHDKADDVFIQFLKGKSQEISKLKLYIDCYYNKGQHFTKQYRTLEGHCSKLQRDLDKVDVFGRDDLGGMRKTFLLDVNRMLQQLAGKAHSNGKACDECEVKQ